jgi:phosphate transport system substrate-binding protein
VSSPFTLASDGWGVPQITMLVACAFLLAAIVLPPLLSRRLRGSKR